jgi:glycine dehydrogenase subunit 2
MTLRKYRQADWEEPLIFELGREDRVGFDVPSLEPELIDTVADITEFVPNGMLRTKPAELPEVSEIEVLRHFIHLSQMN